jgi:hypothetical protein
MRTFFLALIVLIVVKNVVAQNVLQVFSLSGHGSSSVANVLAGEWKMESVFAEHDRPYAGSNSLQSKSGGSTTMVNMKGFGGPSGDNSDEASLNAIVMHAKEIGHINGLLLVVNGEDMALSSLTGLLQMYVDTFGSEMVNQLGVVITRSFLIDDEKITAFRSELDAVLSTLTGRPVRDLPVWLMETRMERVEARLILDSAVQEVLNNLAVVAGEIKEWLEQQPALDVTNVVPAAHPHHRKEIEAMEKLQLALDNYHKEWLKALQRAEKDLLHVVEEVRTFAAAEAKDSYEKAQVIAALAGDLGLSQYERVTILKTATFALSLVVPNASKGIDNVAKGALKTGT